MQDIEVWKKHPLSHYLISNKGRILNPHTNTYVKPYISQAGYALVAKRITKGSRSLHRAMMEAFFGLIPENLVVNHKDGNKLNNILSNLEIVTHAYNTQHAYATGLAHGRRGEDHHSNKVTEEDVLSMYAMFEMGLNNDYVAEKFNLHSRYVSLVRHGKRWEHVYNRVGKTFPRSFTIGAYTLTQVAEAIELLKLSDISNINISKQTGIEVSNISRLRHGKIWQDFVKFYESKIEKSLA